MSAESTQPAETGRERPPLLHICPCGGTEIEFDYTKPTRAMCPTCRFPTNLVRPSPDVREAMRRRPIA